MSESTPFSNVCIVGTGARGIAACRALSEYGIGFDCFEKCDSVAESLFETSGVATDPGRSDRAGGESGDLDACAIAEALEAYASSFGLHARIHFGNAVEYVRRLRSGVWRVHLEEGAPRHYDAIIVAAGRPRRRVIENGAEFPVPAGLSFLDPEEQSALCDGIPLWNHLIHPRYPNLFMLSRMPTTRLTISVAQEQSKFAASCLAGEYKLPSQLEMERECRALLQLHAPELDFQQNRCPSSVVDTRYVFHIRSERVRRTRPQRPLAGVVRALGG